MYPATSVTLQDAAEEGNERAQLALDVFAYRVAKYVGSYAAAMNGVDNIVFTAGIGENDCEMRKAICAYLGYLGIEINDEANGKRGEEIVISTPDSKVTSTCYSYKRRTCNLSRDSSTCVGKDLFNKKI